MPTDVIADLIFRMMDRACGLTHHAGHCGLLSSHFTFGYDEDRDIFRASVPNPLYPLWVWSVFRSLKDAR